MAPVRDGAVVLRTFSWAGQARVMRAKASPPARSRRRNLSERMSATAPPAPAGRIASLYTNLAAPADRALEAETGGYDQNQRHDLGLPLARRDLL
jgi:hypothetical protein